MKTTVRINEFKRVLAESLQVVQAKATIPVLANVKMDVNRVNRATIFATNLGTAIMQTFEVVNGETGSFLLPAKKAYDFLRGHVGGTATIETAPDGQHVTIKTEKFLMKVCVESVSMFPTFETMPEVRQEISLKFLKNLITRVEAVCPGKQNGSLPPVTLIESNGRRLRAVATDGHRIAIADALGDWGMFTAQLPKTFLPQIKRRAGTTVQFAESDRNYFYRTDSVLVQCRKPAAAFPRYQKVVDGIAFKGAIRLASAEFGSAVLNVLSAEKKLRSVTLDVCGECLQVSTDGQNSATGSLVVASEGNADTTVRLNPRYILDFLALAEGDITMHFQNGARGLVKFSSGKNFEHLIMPLKPPESAAEAKSSVA